MSVVEQKAPKDADKLKKIDFKMVSFTLAGKDYGIDILKVKEIRKAGNFTHVPNTPIYVRGVDNLRGDIIPIIDLRMMFNLPAETKQPGALENIIILRLDELVLGIVVDNIEKVVGISKETIQPPHPIFGDINVKYISGVVENDSRLYIILDTDRIFLQQPDTQAAQKVKAEPVPAVAQEPVSVPAVVEQVSLDIQFLKETLATFAQFYVTDLTLGWVKERAAVWNKDRTSKGMDFQLNGKDDALEFLQNFYSPNSQKLWDPADAKALFSTLDLEGTQVTVWNPGCGQGFESYSLACGLMLQYPDKNIKIWANDKDLLNISMAPALAFSEIPDEYQSFAVKTKSGFQFTTEFKSKILFEYHDITHMNPFSDLHMIVCRDTLCFLKPDEQERILSDFSEKLRVGGYLILGKNESLELGSDWKTVDHDQMSIYQKL